MNKTIFNISKMDCPSEEQIIRMKLQNITDVKSLEFDIPNRQLIVYHNGEAGTIFSTLDALNFGTTLISTENSESTFENESSESQRKLLWTVLIINFSFFAIEIIAGVIAKSMGLVADSLDMLADSIVYGLALFAVGGTLIRKKNVAKIAGYFQIILAAIGFIEVVRRFIGIEEIPEFRTMIFVSIVALAANIICLYLMQKNKSKEAHMQASMIFTSNDVIVNSGVIIAGLMVHWFNSNYPDLIIGAIIFVIVARGAYRILRLAK
ncbi:Zinc transporter ZitB [bioreactor metagenome]|jgi:Co/Zn/Cd efflux system component|uniref:Zinc transporter ZitB n=1 Tax=bioreactor metagenome TaxID=1076179 RepID=A0A644W191_9ZZZZ|nr:cation transporter [Parabacteroides sp.]MDD3255429.1 cation transporter [Parabacteroides sp.]MDD4417787.1 cation transporter [Bacteroides graminisolvens]OJV40602.1 MAG: cation transporter [Bacteroidales bacterium 36-12]